MALLRNISFLSPFPLNSFHFAQTHNTLTTQFSIPHLLLFPLINFTPFYHQFCLGIQVMESNLALVNRLGSSYSSDPNCFSTKQIFGLPSLPRKPTGSLSGSRPRSKTLVFALSNPNLGRKSGPNHDYGKRLTGVELFASTSTTVNGGQESVSVGVNPQPYAPPPSSSQFGSPLFWIGVGVGFSALFSFVASRVKNYAMQQAFKTVMGQMGSQNNQFGNSGFPTGPPFGFPPSSPSTVSTGYRYEPPSMSGPSTSTGYTYSPSFTSGPSTSVGSASSGLDQATSPPSAASATVDVLTTKSGDAQPQATDEKEVKTEAKKSAFVDVSPEEAQEKSPFEDPNASSTQMPSGDAKFAEVVQNGAASKEASSAKEGKTGSVLSVEALEKMMEDPTVQKMVYPHLPEEMRNPTSFKWMLQNPMYRQQLQEMLDNMGGSSEWDNRMVDTLKNFNFDSPEVKQQFDQLGLTPEEVISKIMANPDVALAFQNPRVQQAILDCSQNPLNITKYQNDPEVMSVFDKISQLFPGAGGPGGF